MRNRIPRLKLSDKLPGAAVFNGWVESICGAIERALNPSASGIMTISTGPMGMAFHVPPFPVGLGLTTSAITARSGSTLGFGTANMKLFNGTDLAADAAGTSQKVYNFSSTTGGVATGKYFIWTKINGYYFIVSVEC